MLAIQTHMSGQEDFNMKRVLEAIYDFFVEYGEARYEYLKKHSLWS